MSIRVAILTVSDSAVAGTRADVSGPALREHCVSLGWTVSASAVVADETALIGRAIAEWADGNVADLILTTGGTGISARDVTPEATRAVLEREIPGIGELMRVRGLEQTRFSVLSRGLAGTRGRALVVNLPGSPAGAVFSVKVIEHLVAHTVNLLSGKTEH
jgi:molybdenum cofactor synthesis domain-containing protein